MPTANTFEQHAFAHQAFWDFSYDHYFKADVEAACLALQTFHHGSVNFALLMLWLDSQHIVLSADQRHRLQQSLQPTDGLLQDYRAMRRALKPQLDDAGYQQLKDFELKVERQQQHDLIAHLNQMTLQAVTPDEPATNLARYCQSIGALALMDKLLAR